MRIALVDSRPIIRDGLALLLRDLFEDGRVAIADTSADLPRATDTVDVALVSMDCDAEAPLDLLAETVARLDAPVIALNVAENGECVRACLHRGARGVVTVEAEAASLKSTIEQVLAGAVVAPVELLAGIDRAHDNVVTCAFGRPLTERQEAILEAIADGMTNKEIGRQLGIAEGSVKVHIKTIFRKLGVNNRTQAAARVLNGRSSRAAAS